jgi:alanine dehydrogenase
VLRIEGVYAFDQDGGHRRPLPRSRSGGLTRDDVYAELGEIITGRKPGRTSGEEITIFDSTGTALQDVAAAAVVYERALRDGVGVRLNLAG